MLGDLRSRLTYANVVSTLCLFIVLGGTSYAVATGSIDSREIKDNTIGSKDIRNRAITNTDVKPGTLDGSRLADNSLGGREVVESQLGKVPSAAHADTAGTAATAATANSAGRATSAATADSLTDVGIARVFFRSTSATPQKVLDMGGLVLRASCVPFDTPTVTASTRSDGATLCSYAIGLGGGISDNHTYIGLNDEAGEQPLVASVNHSGQTVYTAADGRTVTVDWQALRLIEGCLFAGVAVSR